MPGKTGLEIATEVEENWPACRILFLTGYADFDYMYRSSKFKNAAFLLKTEDNATILQTVRDTIAKLDEENEHRKLLSKEHSKDIYVNYLLHRDRFRKLLLGQHISVFTKELSFLPGPFLFDLKRPFFLILLKFSDEQLTQQSANDPRFIISVIQQISSCLDDRFATSVCPVDATSWAVFYNLTHPSKKVPTHCFCTYVKHSTREALHLFSMHYSQFLCSATVKSPGNMQALSMHS